MLLVALLSLHHLLQASCTPPHHYHNSQPQMEYVNAHMSNQYSQFYSNQYQYSPQSNFHFQSSMTSAPFTAMECIDGTQIPVYKLKLYMDGMIVYGYPDMNGIPPILHAVKYQQNSQPAPTTSYFQPFVYYPVTFIPVYPMVPLMTAASNSQSSNDAKRPPNKIQQRRRHWRDTKKEKDSAAPVASSSSEQPDSSTLNDANTSPEISFDSEEIASLKKEMEDRILSTQKISSTNDDTSEKVDNENRFAALELLESEDEDEEPNGEEYQAPPLVSRTKLEKQKSEKAYTKKKKLKSREKSVNRPNKKQVDEKLEAEWLKDMEFMYNRYQVQMPPLPLPLHSQAKITISLLVPDMITSCLKEGATKNWQEILFSYNQFVISLFTTEVSYQSLETDLTSILVKVKKLLEKIERNQEEITRHGNILRLSYKLKSSGLYIDDAIVRDMNIFVTRSMVYLKSMSQFFRVHTLLLTKYRELQGFLTDSAFTKEITNALLLGNKIKLLITQLWPTINDLYAAIERNQNE